MKRIINFLDQQIKQQNKHLYRFHYEKIFCPFEHDIVLRCNKCQYFGKRTEQ